VKDKQFQSVFMAEGFTQQPKGATAQRSGISISFMKKYSAHNSLPLSSFSAFV
jgi:hypothetical protein